MDVISRLERKYRLTPSAYVRLRNRLAAFARQDPFTVRAGGRYVVRSLYFDTHDLAAYHEREEGLFGRIKLRLRVYTGAESGLERVRVEIKTRRGAIMEKHSAFTTYDNYRHLLETRSWIDRSDAVLSEFERLLRTHDARPTLLVDYRREGLVARDGSPVRVTLDHEVRSARAASLLPGAIVMRPHRPRCVVLEIKTTGRRLPDWLVPMIRDQSLSLVSNSKYVQGVEAVHLAMTGSGGVQ